MTQKIKEVEICNYPNLVQEKLDDEMGNINKEEKLFKKTFAKIKARTNRQDRYMSIEEVRELLDLSEKHEYTENKIISISTEGYSYIEHQLKNGFSLQEVLEEFYIKDSKELQEINDSELVLKLEVVDLSKSVNQHKLVFRIVVKDFERY